MSDTHDCIILANFRSMYCFIFSCNRIAGWSVNIQVNYTDFCLQGMIHHDVWNHAEKCKWSHIQIFVISRMKRVKVLRWLHGSMLQTFTLAVQQCNAKIRKQVTAAFGSSSHAFENCKCPRLYVVALWQVALGLTPLLSSPLPSFQLILFSLISVILSLLKVTSW